MAHSPNTKVLPLRLFSWNVKGLGGPVKRAKVLSHLKHLQTGIAYLQETHMRNVDHNRLRSSWVGQSFHSNFNSRSRGVAILIHKKISFSSTEVISDPHGRYIIVTGLLFHIPVILVNIYAPNWDNADFITKLCASLPNLDSHHLIFGGDLNCVINPNLDHSSPKSQSPSKMAKAIFA